MENSSYFKLEKSRFSSFGFTLIEVLVVMTMVSLVLSIALVMNMDDYRGFLFRDERDALVTVLQKARSQAIHNVCLGGACTDGLPHGVHISGNTYTIFQGSTYDANNSTNQTFQGNDRITVTPTSPDVVFSQLSGQVPNPWSAQLNDQYSRNLSIQVNIEGRINY